MAAFVGLNAAVLPRALRTTNHTCLSPRRRRPRRWPPQRTLRASLSSSSDGGAGELGQTPEDRRAELLDEQLGGVRTRRGAWAAYVSASNTIVTLFPVWTLLAALLALSRPSSFQWFNTSYFSVSLGALMLAMGITLRLNDFLRVFRRLGAVGVGFVGCYAVMPLLAYALARAFSLPTALTAGMMLVSSVNGGQATSLCAYIGRGNVALAVLSTTVTTVSAIFMTPLLCKLLVGAVVPMNAWGIAQSTMKIVLIPITSGMLLSRYAPRVVRAVLPFSPVLGMVSTVLLVGSSVGQCAAPIRAAGLGLQLPMILLHVLGGAAGYYLSKALGFNEVVRRTMAIATLLKSSAFAFLLASLHFPLYDVRIPAALSLVWMALTGSTIAVIWRYMPIRATKMKFNRALGQPRGPFDRWVKTLLERSAERDDARA